MCAVPPRLPRKKIDLSAISVAQMREAAAAWRPYTIGSKQIHDRVDDLIDEIERLRNEKGDGNDRV